MTLNQRSHKIVEKFIDDMLTKDDLVAYKGLKEYFVGYEACLDEDNNDCFCNWIERRNDLSQDQKDLITGEGNFIDLYFHTLQEFKDAKSN